MALPAAGGSQTSLGGDLDSTSPGPFRSTSLYISGGQPLQVLEASLPGGDVEKKD